MRKKYYKRRSSSGRIIAFIIVILITTIYYLLNHFGNNELMNFISSNLIIQTFLIFLSSLTIVSPFLPITFRKELNDEKVKKILSKEIKVYQYNEKENERIEKDASI